MPEHHLFETDGRTDTRTSVQAAISREMVRIYKEQFGRGPTRAKTEFAGPDIVLCTLENSFTPAERRLQELGEDQRLRDTRLFFQHATKKEFFQVIERLLNRRVRAFISGLDAHQDVSVEIFYLEDLDEADLTVGLEDRPAHVPDRADVFEPRLGADLLA